MAPAACIAGGFVVSWVFSRFTKAITNVWSKKKSKTTISPELALLVMDKKII